MALTTLAAAEAWLGITSDGGGPVDKGVSRLIAATSSAILAFLDRPTLASRSYTEIRNGTRTQQMMLKQWPVTSVSSLTLGDLSIPSGVEPAPGSGFLTPGFLFSPWDGSIPGEQCVLNLRGYGFAGGLQNTAITYQAGYLVSGETQAVPSVAPFTLSTLNSLGSWGSDGGVLYEATGVALVAVNGAPAVGQYSVSPTGVYTFNEADAGEQVNISYGFTPAVVEQACLDGIQMYSASQSLNPFLKSEKYEQVSFSYNTNLGSIAGVNPGNTLLSPTITSVLMPFRRVMRYR